MIPDSISHTWPHVLEATISTPFVHLPPKSRVDIDLKLTLLRSGININNNNNNNNQNFNTTVKNFQVELWERAIYRVARTVKKEDNGIQDTTKLIIVGIRDRVVSTQAMSKGWPAPVSSLSSSSTSTSAASTTIERTIQFTTPNTVRDPDELYSSRNCNASTYSRISKQERDQFNNSGECTDEIGVGLSNVEYGAIDIEIQHFLRFKVNINTSSGQETVSNTGSSLANGLEMERHLGDIPVVVKGISIGVPECDGTGLPSYMGSFSTSVLSLAETQQYEANFDSTGTALSPYSASSSVYALTEQERVSSEQHRSGTISLGGSARNSMLSLASISPSVPDDYENDDVFMTVMGFRSSKTPPPYTDSIDGRSLSESN
ncbi:hypothetical protein BGX28_002130 [Mortierella sp. GBA30]|nr:hypothetical protein BGX28_002130 [Mortierella sp. GBA30]